MGYFSYEGAQQDVRRSAEGQLSMLAGRRVDQLAQYRTERIADGKQLAGNAVFADLVRQVLAASPAPPNAMAQLQGWLDKFAAQPDYDQVRLLDPEGGTVVAVLAGAPSPPAVVAQQVPAVLQSRRITFVDFYRSTDDGRVHRALLVPIFDDRDGGRPLGVVELSINPAAYLYPVVGSWPVPSSTGETVLVRRDGDAALYLNPLRSDPAAALARRVPLADMQVPAVQAVLGRTGIVQGIDGGNAPVIAAVRPVPGSPWFLVTEEATAEINAPLQARLLATLLLVVLTLGTAALGAVGLRRRGERRRLRERDEAERVRAWLHEVIARSLDEIYVFDPATLRFRFVNAGACRNLGYTPEELAERTPLDLKPRFTEASFRALLDRLRDGATQTLVFETVHRRRDGSEYPVEVHLQLVESGHGEVCLAVVDDITERRRAHDALVRQKDLYDMLSQANQAMVRASDQDALFRDACRVAVERGHFAFAWVGLVSADGWRVEPVARYGKDGGYVDRVRVVTDASAPTGRGPTAQALRLGRPIIVNDFLQDPSTEAFRALAERLGVRSSGAFPIRRGGAVVGAINLYADEPGFFTDDVVGTLEEMALDVSYALDDFARREALIASESRYRQLFEANPHPMWVEDDETLQILAVNDAALAHYGASREAFLARTGIDILAPEEVARWRAWLLEARRSGRVEAGIWHHRTSDGTSIDAEVAVHALDVDGRRAWLVLAHDVTARLAAERGQRLAAAALASTRDSVMITDLKPRIVTVNAAFTTITGYTEVEVVGRNPRLLQSGRHDRAFYEAMWAALRKTGYWRGELWNRRKNGELYPAWVTISAVRDADGHPTHYVEVATDLGELRESQARIEYLAHHDVLTDLPNRLLLESNLELALRRAEGAGAGVAVLLVSVDRFNTINDSLGFAAGDEVLRAVGRRLRERLPVGNLVARVGGADFGVLLNALDDLGHAATVAADLLAALEEPLVLSGGARVYPRASIGIAVQSHDGLTALDLLSAADTAMHDARAGGGNRFSFFTADLNSRALARLELETALRQALERREFVLHYQPKVDLRSGRIVGAEGLLRWECPGRGLVPPSDFIPVAEQNGLIVPIGAWVIGEACRQLRAWLDAGLAEARVAVNVSARQFRDPGLEQTVTAALERYRLEPERLTLELTESLLMEDVDEALERVAHLGRIGVGLSLDDFGTGYSSLAYLSRLPLRELKIDRSFVSGMTTDSSAVTIAAAVIALAHLMHLTVVAEGVEAGTQAELLRRFECDEAQGFYFSRPVTADAFADLLRKGLLPPSPERPAR